MLLPKITGKQGMVSPGVIYRILCEQVYCVRDDRSCFTEQFNVAHQFLYILCSVLALPGVPKLSPGPNFGTVRKFIIVGLELSPWA